ncbi:MAG: tetratricopeptide repeat protein [Magnetococcales bacterium]|nr:tetratricopeptide repeat protein [Magnetococcales bacterium]
MTIQEEKNIIDSDPKFSLEHFMQNFQRVPGLVQAGLLDDASRILEQALILWPENLELLIYLANILWNMKSYDRAEELTSRGLQLAPDNIVLHLFMGDIAKFRKNVDVAMFHFREVIRLEPDNVDGLHQYGAILAECNRHDEAVAVLQRILKFRPDMAECHESIALVYRQQGFEILANIHLRLKDHLDRVNVPHNPENEVNNTYFLDGNKARAAARAGLQVKIFNAFPAPQICYHSDPTLAGDGLETLIYLPMDHVTNFFLESRLRLPATVDFNPTDPQQVRMAMVVARAVCATIQLRRKTLQQLEMDGRQIKPDFMPGQPWRIYLSTSRWSTVMQHASRNMALAMERLGCDVRFDIEENNLELLLMHHILKNYCTFNPHVTININSRNNTWLHPDVFNIVWYQDPMPEINQEKPLPWRQRDIVFSAYPHFDDAIRKTGVRQLHRQDLCVDLNLFRVMQPREERRKVVFMGSSYLNVLKGLPGEELVLRELGDMIEQEMSITSTHIQNLVDRTQLSFLHVSMYLHTHVIRKHTIEWLCELAPELDWEVEIYGKGWENMPVVAPYFRGEVPHGPAVAAIYNQARYALAVHQQMVKSQRLAEISACGCIPVLFDDRVNAELPHWDDEILFFKSKVGLRDCLRQEPKNDPTTIAQAYSYDEFAMRILRMVEEEVAAVGSNRFVQKPETI